MKTIRKALIIFILGVVGATLLMLLVNCLPNDKMQQHISESVEVMENEGDYRELIPGYISSRLDNFTDSIMLLSAVHKEEGASLIERTMHIYRVSYSDKRPSESLVAYGKGETNYSISSYSRYWHGYQIILKPLLMIFNYQEIRYINMSVQILIAIMVVLLMWKRNLQIYILPYLIMNFSLMPISIALSLQFSNIFYIMNLALGALLMWYEMLKKDGNMVIYFLIVGMATSFFDFLTYPLATLGIPIIMFYVLEKKETIVHNMINLIKYCFTWAVGYGGMWMSKWIIGSIFLRENIINDALVAIFSRTSSEVSYAEFTRKEVILRNIKVMFEMPIKYMVLIFLIVTLAYLIMKMIKDKKNYICNFHYLIIACMPCAWYVVLANHSYVHFWFTYRELVILIFAMLVWCCKNVEECKKSRLDLYEK